MKFPIALSIVGLLLVLSSCTYHASDYKVRDHEIICRDSVTKEPSVNADVYGNVAAFVVKGHSVLAYRDNNNKFHIIFLSKNDCMIF